MPAAVASAPPRSDKKTNRPHGGRAVRETKPQVEVAGIEPASFANRPGLLRAQSTADFLSPGGLADQPPTGSAADWCPEPDPAAGSGRPAFLLMPDTGSKANPG